MRHILMIDIRSEEEYNSLYIRGSFHVDLAAFTKEELLELVLKTAKSFAEYNPKENDTLRRLLIVTKGPLVSKDPAIEKLTKMVKSLNCITQILSLRDGIESVKAKYPFVLVSKSSPDSDYGFAASRFPSVVSEGKLFLGGLLNAGATRQLEAMGITTLIGVAPNPLTNVDKRFRYMHFPFTENKGSQQIDLLDFETIVETIAEGIEKGERMLVFSVVWHKTECRMDRELSRR
eukprot:TRINITY_DN1295_c0_g1_i2.p1 TRINITY_DN1295_c0_g1~~TRINITY_DN1295_c0_g1_i2.p1  ORF type:complete len:233 (-),score=65.24 TRINITY_DN1295_c0_g1_i2:542-1240(-)